MIEFGFFCYCNQNFPRKTMKSKDQQHSEKTCNHSKIVLKSFQNKRLLFTGKIFLPIHSMFVTPFEVHSDTIQLLCYEFGCELDTVKNWFAAEPEQYGTRWKCLFFDLNQMLSSPRQIQTKFFFLEFDFSFISLETVVLLQILSSIQLS